MANNTNNVETIPQGHSSQPQQPQPQPQQPQQQQSAEATVDSTDKKHICKACEKPIVSGSFALAKVPDGNGEHAYHNACFVCHRCATELSGKPFLQKDNHLYCEECFEFFLPRCAGCTQIIREEYLVAFEKCFHTACFVCTVCKQPFPNGVYSSLNDQAYCEQHYAEAVGEVCFKCKKPMKGQIFDSGNSRKYHPQCFLCAEGQHEIGEGVPFAEHDGETYCQSHFEQLFSEKCHECKQPLKGNYLKVLDLNLHTECWKCSRCSVVLTSETAALDKTRNAFVCKNCVDIMKNEKATVKPAS